MVLAMGGINLYETGRMDAASTEVRGTWLPGVVALSELGAAIGDTRALTLRSIIVDEPTVRQHTMARIKANLQALPKQFDAYESAITEAENRKLYDHFVSTYETYRGLQQQILDAVDAGRIDDADRLANGPLAEYAGAMTKALDELIRFNAENAFAAAQLSDEAADEARVVAVVALSAILLITVGAATLLTRSIILPWATP